MSYLFLVSSCRFSRNKFLLKCTLILAVWKMGRNIQSERFLLQIRLLRWAGISLREKETIWFHLYSYVILGAILSASILSIHEIMTHTDRLDTLTENLVFGGALLMAFVKTWYMYLIGKTLGKAMVLLENDVFVPNDKRGGSEKEEEILNGCMVYANAQGIILVGISAFYALAPSVKTAILRFSHSDNSSYWMLPFGDVSILQADHTPVYEVVWVYQCIANFMACIGYSSSNVYTAAIMAFLSAQCRMLQNSIKMSVKRGSTLTMQKINGYGNKADLEVPKDDWKELQKTLKEIVEYHILITDTTNKFEKIFCIPTLLDFFGLSVIICLALFYGTLVPGLNYRFIQMVALTIGSTSLQFMTSYWGNEVTVQYLEIGKACNDVDYVGTDIRFQKGLCLIIQRTQKAIHFTVGKFAPLTLGTFITVLKAAYSYCMLLHNLGI